MANRARRLIEDAGRLYGRRRDRVNVRDGEGRYHEGDAYPKAEKVIRIRFGIGCEARAHSEEIGQELDVTREKHPQDEASEALRQVRATREPPPAGPDGRR